MSDERVERLLDWPYQGETMAQEAADRIEALTAENERMRKELEDIANDYEAGYPLSHDTIKYAARAALKGATP